MAAARSGEPVISVSGFTKRYGSVAAVRDISFQVARAEIFGLLGRNGAGKTTTVECLQGLRQADAGELRVLGLDPRTQASELRRHVGCQLQESALPGRIKVWEALEWFASFSSQGGDWERLIGEWGLAGKRNAHFCELSGGQRQRLFIALALVNEPQIVFLDEMTTGLDPAARHVAWGLIEAIRTRGTTVVLVTHAMEEAERLCDRVAIMEAGRIVAVDTPSGLVAKHTRDVTVRFDAGGHDVSWLSAIPSVAAVTERGGQAAVTGHGPVLVDVAAALAAHGLRPVDLRVDQPSLEDVFLQITGHELDEGLAMHALSKSTAVEAKLFLREPMTVAFTLALPLLFLFVMGGVFGNEPDPQYYRGAGALDYYVPAYCGLVWTAVGLLALPVHLAHYREDGVLRRLRASPARPWVVLGAQLLVTFLISLAGSVLIVVMAALVYHIHAPRSVPGFFGAWLLCGVLFSALGVLLASIPSSRGALSAGLGLFFTMMMLCGAGPPPEVLNGAMHWVSNLLPLTYMLRLLQDPWLGLSWSLTDTAVVAAFILGAAASARLLFRWD